MRKGTLATAGRALSVCLILATQAQAAGEGTSKAADWKGAYLGASLGVIFNESRLHATNSNFIHRSYSEDIDFDSVLPGLQLGYNHQTETGWIFGAEGDFTYPDARGDFTYRSRTQPGVYDRFTVKNRLQGSVRARFGKALDDFFPYLTAGVSFADTGLRYDNEQGQSYERSSTQVGFIVGGGLEYSLMDHLSLRAEYLYANYGDAESLNTRTVSCITDPNGNLDADLVSHTLRAGLNYRF